VRVGKEGHIYTDRRRALDVLGAMTLKEKIAQLISIWIEIRNDGTFGLREAFIKEKKEAHSHTEVLKDGIGQLTRPFGTMANGIIEQAKAINTIQKFLIEQTRLKIPAMFHEECLTGVMVKGATIFPSALNYGSTWDTELIQRIAKTIGSEMRSLGSHQGLAPVLDVARDARWGRLEETFGEDPYLTGCMGISYVQGLQGKKRSPIATLKHFVGHSGSEGARNHAPVHVGERELRNMYALPFEMVIKEARPGSVMPAYHDIDGIPCTANYSLVTSLLKHNWKFNGLVVADYEAVSQLSTEHHVAADMAEGSALALKAGLDLELPGFTAFRNNLERALDRGLIDIGTIDAAVLRVLREKFRQGVFDHPYIDEQSIRLASDASHALAIEAAEKSLVLLKNKNLLPLKKQQHIAVIGPLADHPYAMYGGYAPPVHLQGLHTPVETVPKRAKTIRKAIEALSGLNVVYEPGCLLYEGFFERSLFFPGDVKAEDITSTKQLSTDTSYIKRAVTVAEKADTVILVVGDLAGLFQQGTVGEGSDTETLRLPGIQEQLMEAVLATGKPTVVVLVSGRPYSIEAANKKAAAILASWLPGEGGGEAIARVLFGLTNPSGKTCLSFPIAAGAMPYAYNHSQKAGGMPKQKSFGAIYPFGFGLSYTQFAYSGGMIEKTTVPTDAHVVIHIDIMNTGLYEGDEIVQVYVRDVQASIVRPVKELKGFSRVTLASGETKHVTFDMPTDVLSFVTDGKRIVEPGVFDVMIGSSSQDILWSGQFTLSGATRVLDRHWRCRTSVTVDS